MKRRALVIGSQTFKLTGVHNDVAAIERRLRERGFEVDRRIGEDASRAGILAGLERLVADSTAADAAVVYYSGHGARFARPGSPRPLQSLVPTDWGKGAFKGILDIELSMWLARLTAKTINVSIILDCCHSGRMWRELGEEVAVRTLAREELSRGEPDEITTFDASMLDAEANPHAIKLVAAEVDRFAFEQELVLDGRITRMGVMTASLVEILDELGPARLSWRSLAMLVRERVMARREIQRPEIEGPGRRYVFEHASTTQAGAVVYFEDGGQPCLRASRVLGAEVGLRYSIMPLGIDELDRGRELAQAVVVGMSAAAARVRLEPQDARPPLGSLAFPLSPARGRLAVRVRGVGEAAEALRELLDASAWVRAAQTDEGVLLQVDVDEARSTLVRGEELLGFPEPPTATLARLEHWAHAEALRELGSGDLSDRFEVGWGRVVADEQVPMSAGETVHVEDRLYVEFHNTSTRALFVACFDVGVDGTVALLNRAEPSGTRVEPNGFYTLGLELGEGGLPTSWPAGIPAQAPLRESLVVIVSSERHDFVAWETESDGEGQRNLRASRAEPRSGHAVRRFDFSLHPRPRHEVERP